MNLAIPFVPAIGGIVFHAATHGDEFIKLAKMVENLTNLPLKPKKTYEVYRSINNGITEYIGYTSNFLRRASEHLRETNRIINKIPGLEDLTIHDARAVEQLLIEHFCVKKTKGTLSNIINSISPKRGSFYNNAIIRGREILDSVDVDWRQWR